MSTEAQRPPSGSGHAQGQETTPVNSQSPSGSDLAEFDPEEAGVVSLPIGTPMPSDVYRKLKEESIQPSPAPPEPEANATHDSEDPSED